jgi:hypothetical protein
LFDKKTYQREYYKKYRERNLDKLREYDRDRWKNSPARRTEHLEVSRRRKRELYWADPDTSRAFARDRKKQNRAYYSQLQRLRHCRIKEAMPQWVDKAAVVEVYRNCPEGYEVDHIVPLLGKNVCGLHVPWNLQYLTPQENRRKSNKCG